MLSTFPTSGQDEHMEGWGATGLLVKELPPQSSRPAYVFELPFETPSNNVIKGMHWQKYRQLRGMWRIQVLKALQGRRPPQPLNRAALAIERFSAGQLDWDNAYGGLKPLLDCLVAATPRNPDGLGILTDDSPGHMPYPPFVSQRKAPKGQGRTVVKIYEVP